MQVLSGNVGTQRFEIHFIQLSKLLAITLKESHKKYLEPYETLYVALDRDATKKSYTIASELTSAGFKNVKVKVLHEYDLKCYSTEEIKEMFYG